MQVAHMLPSSVPRSEKLSFRNYRNFYGFCSMQCSRNRSSCKVCGLNAILHQTIPQYTIHLYTVHFLNTYIPVCKYILLWNQERPKNPSLLIDHQNMKFLRASAQFQSITLPFLGTEGCKCTLFLAVHSLRRPKSTAQWFWNPTVSGGIATKVSRGQASPLNVGELLHPWQALASSVQRFLFPVTCGSVS